MAVLTADIAIAEETRAPDDIPNTTKVDAEGLINAVSKHDRLVLIDSRIAMDRKQGYIEGAISLPDTETSCESLAKLIPELGQAALFYCNGVKCGRSVKAIYVAQKCGYTNLYWFRGGFEEWTEKGYPFLKE
ncbi:MAG: rhodanese-like domain-containing protein [Gammaproteobacteria bacterium]|nr:rhodanese-like domain-containing protein [Gammaproteobacteria bacterium]